MYRCGKVNNITIWLRRKTNKTNRFKLKTCKRFDLTILKVNQIHYKRIEFFTKDLTLNLMLPHVVTHWHNHMQAPNPRTPSLLGFTPTQAVFLVTLRLHSKVLDHLHLLILMQQLVLPILDCSFGFGRFLCSSKVQNLSNLTKSNIQVFFSSLKTWLGFSFYMWRSLSEILNVFAGLGLFKNLQKNCVCDFRSVEPNSRLV